MNIKNYGNFRHRRAAFFSLCAFLCQLFAPLGGALAEAGGFEALNVVAPAKSDVVLDDSDVELARSRKANVLFFLDTSNAMTFSPKGMQPNVILNAAQTAGDWKKTEEIYGFTQPTVIEMMRYATYGTSSLPTANGNGTRYSGSGNDMYGRDVDPDNNFIYTGDVEKDMKNEKNKNNYYFPLYCENDDTDPIANLYGAGIKNSVNGNDDLTLAYMYRSENDFIDVLKKELVGSDYTYNYNEIEPNKSMPYAMVFKNPKHWRGWQGPGPIRTEDLVPNDSRMYQMKVVMWQLLNDPSNFENIRFGMMTGYASPTYRGMLISQYKAYPFGAKPANGETYKYGTMAKTITGQKASHTIDGQSYAVWANNITEPVFYPNGSRRDKDVFRVVNRGYLRLPIAEYTKLWEKDKNAVQRTINHAQKFRLWIDGIEDVGQTSGSNYQNKYFYYHVNPELKSSGNMPLATAIYPYPKNDELKHEWYLSNSYIFYALRNKFASYSIQASTDGAKGRTTVAARAFFHSGSGEAVGSVLDFFSPDPEWTSKSSVGVSAKIDDLDPISFPVTDECEDNWLVVITSGNAASGEGGDGIVYTAEEAIANLYYSTDKNNEGKGEGPYGATYKPLTKLVVDGKERSYEKIHPNKPIRTLVIGFTAKPENESDPAVRKNLEIMEENLNRMARAGQSGNPEETSENRDFKPTLVDNAADLLHAIQEAFKLINSDLEQPEKGSMLEGGSVEQNADDEELNLYSATYRIVNSNQWEGGLRRYATVKQDDGSLEVTRKAEMGGQLLAGRKSGGNWRNIQYWSVSGKKFTPLEGAAVDGEFAALTGLEEEKMRAYGDAWDIGCSPAEAFRQWLLGYDFSYKIYKDTGSKTKALFPREYMLADFGQSGLVIAGPPEWANSLPGYGPWTREQADRATRLYGQTNDGILHVIEPERLKERKALLVPPVLLPTRLAATKTSASTGGTRAWIDVVAPENSMDLSPDRRSRPLYLLDGPLQLRHFDLDSGGEPGDWGSYLVAPLGRAGNGIYMMDVSDPDDPKFMWYRETVVDGNTGEDGASFTSEVSSVGLDAIDTALTVVTGQQVNWRSDLTDDDESHGFRQLGFNSPKPGLTVVGEVAGDGNRSFYLQNIIILPGGMKSHIDKDAGGLEKYNGTEGAALFVVDPKDGTPLRTFNSHSGNIENTGAPIPTSAPAMGMMVSEPSLYRSDLNAYVTSKAFAADNLGRIFMVNFGDDLDPDRDSSKTPSDWEISLAASLQKKEGVVDGNFAIPYGVAIYKKNSRLWIAGGTANVGARDNDANNSAMLENGEQVVFAFNTEARTDSDPQYRGEDWKELAWDGGVDSVLTPIEDDETGWFIPLETGRAKYKDEYVSAKPIIIKGTLYAATYMDKVIENAEKGKCGERNMDGVSKLYALDVATGAPALWDGAQEKAQEFRGIKITGLTHSKRGSRETLVVTYDTVNASSDNLDEVADKEDKVKRPDSGGVEKAPFFTIDEGAVRGATLKNASSVIDYWREK